MVKKIITLSVVSVLVIAGAIGFSNLNSYADEQKDVKKLAVLAGNYIDKHHHLLNKAVKAMDNQPLQINEIVADVDLLQISVGEVEFRKGIRQVEGSSSANDQSVINTLIEEKLVMSYAIRNGVFPSEKEVYEFINAEKTNYYQSEVYQKLIDEFCSAAGMSIDEYWDTYQYYNAFRMATFKNASDNAIQDGIKNGELKALDSNMTAEENSQIYQKYVKYWNDIKLKLKKEKTITINKQLNNYDFNVDASKLYL